MWTHDRTCSYRQELYNGVDITLGPKVERCPLPNIYIPTRSADDWTQLLADPVKHWRTGYSARTLAQSWQDADGLPTEITEAFTASENLAGIKLLLAIPEHQVPLVGGSRPSQNDIWALARVGNELVSIAVEGKVAEPFGPTMSDWIAEGSTGKAARLAFLRRELNLNEELAGNIRYQLLHRTASAIIEAKRFCASHAVMLVHSFSPSRDWLQDYEEFAKLLRAEATINKVVSAGNRGGIHLHIGWVCGNEKYLSK